MIDNPALGIDSAEARTRINTFEVLAGLVGGTVGVDGALWPAGYIRVTKVFRYALT